MKNYIEINEVPIFWPHYEKNTAYIFSTYQDHIDEFHRI